MNIKFVIQDANNIDSVSFDDPDVGTVELTADETIDLLITARAYIQGIKSLDPEIHEKALQIMDEIRTENPELSESYKIFLSAMCK